METDKIPATEVSNWQPITDPVDLAVLGKTGEELTECATAIFRCIIQGVGACEPTTKKVNRDWLTDEIADVEALFLHLKRHYDLDAKVIQERRLRKYQFKLPWFRALRRGRNYAPDRWHSPPVDRG